MKTIGVIGLGSIGMRHAKNLRAMGHSVLGHDPALDKTLGLFFPESIDTILKESDAIVIASPTEHHSLHIELCAKNNKPCLVEKPIARRLSGSLFSSLKTVTMVGYNLRWHSCVKKAKEWLDAGLIGNPIWSQFTLGQFNDRPHYLRDGVILNWSHEIDLCTYLLGNAVVAASSTRLTDGKDDLTDILLTHEGGCRSAVHLDYLTNPEIREFTIAGTKGSIEANLHSRWAWAATADNREVHTGTDSWNDNYIEEMQAFLDRCDGKETIGCTGEEGLDVLKICLEVRKQAGL